MSVHLDRGAVDMEARDKNLREVLADLFFIMDVNFDLPPEVQGTITVNLHNATYQQALDTLLGNQFTYTIGPHDVIYIHRGGTTWRPGWEEPAA